ncbi:hypothetical protein J1614_012242 [Plenodomus biglobosus]|nr:hypothetical protein J1614_012242 [Plenodomus biglobosus]
MVGGALVSLKEHGLSLYWSGRSDGPEYGESRESMENDPVYQKRNKWYVIVFVPTRAGVF